MPWNSQDLAKIDKAIASGAQEVQFEDQKVIYRSVDQLLKARAEIVMELSQTGTPVKRMVRICTESGW